MYTNGEYSAGSTYQFKDETSGPIFYYKLKMVDFDGYFSESSILSSNCNSGNVDWVTFPVPSEKSITIEINSNKNFMDEVLLVDIQGKIVKTIPIQVVIGSNSFHVELDEIISGMYFLKMSNLNEVYKPLKILK